MLIVVIDGYGESDISGMLCLFSIVNTDLNWLFRILAI